jgi:hypothetical protein
MDQIESAIAPRLRAKSISLLLALLLFSCFLAGCVEEEGTKECDNDSDGDGICDEDEDTQGDGGGDSGSDPDIPTHSHFPLDIDRVV